MVIGHRKLPKIGPVHELIVSTHIHIRLKSGFSHVNEYRSHTVIKPLTAECAVSG
jgi:hypothetical protein